MPQDLSIGQILGARYRLRRRVGRGGFGEVWQAERLSTGQAVAIKVLLKDDDIARVVTQRFLREAQTISALKHPNTVRLYDFGSEPDGQLYMVLEFIEGQTLQQRLRTLAEQDQHPTQADVGELAIQVLRSLTEAHAAGVVHRDVKPANLMLQPIDAETSVVRVLDFGVARTRESTLTGNGLAVGTPSFMSPEQCLGHAVDGRADLYGLGVVMYRCLTGRLPFEGKPHAVIMHHIGTPPPPLRRMARTPVSDSFVDLVDRALAKDPQQRFADARTMRQALESLRGQAPVVPDAPKLFAPQLASTAGTVDASALLESETANTAADEPGPALLQHDGFRKPR